MMKRILAIFLCSAMLFCFIACSENNGINSQPTEIATQNETAGTESTDMTEQPTKPTTEVTETPTTPSESSTNPPTDPVPTENNTDGQTSAIFNTNNIKRITFYAYYGSGKGSDVPAENLSEIIAWLNSFAIDEEAPDILPPGTNTVHVEIEYSDGTIIKQGTDIIIIDGICYYLKSDAVPDCYEEILLKVSIN